MSVCCCVMAAAMKSDGWGRAFSEPCPRMIHVIYDSIWSRNTVKKKKERKKKIKKTAKVAKQ